MQIVPGVDFEKLIAAGRERLIEINPATGNRRYREHSNDVMFAMDRMGGKKAVSTMLGVEEIEIEHWIDDHYVPTRYAKQIEKKTKIKVYTLQVSPAGPK